MSTRVIECDQGSEAWHKARCGVITASMFGVARKRLKSGPNKGDFTEEAKNYAFRLAIERISGTPLDEGFETWSMKGGHELEPLARMEHEMASGLIVQRAGFMVTDDGWFGASADGLIGTDEGSEYKCFVAPDKLRSIYIDGDISEIKPQVQGCLWLSGRKRWHACLYCPALEPAKKQLWWRVFERDDEYIDEMEVDLMKFATLVVDMETSLRKEAA